MKAFKTLFSAFTLLVLISSCVINLDVWSVHGKGPVATKTFDLPEFQSIVIRGSVDVDYTQVPDAKPSVVLVAQENLLEYFDIQVVDGVLNISVARNVNISSTEDIKVKASSSVLDGVKILGSGDCDLKGRLVADDFALVVNGSGDIDIDALTAEATSVQVYGSGDVDITCVDAGDIEVIIAGSGDVELSGTARSLRSKVNGSGDVNARKLSVEMR